MDDDAAVAVAAVPDELTDSSVNVASSSVAIDALIQFIIHTAPPFFNVTVTDSLSSHLTLTLPLLSTASTLFLTFHQQSWSLKTAFTRTPVLIYMIRQRPLDAEKPMSQQVQLVWMAGDVEEKEKNEEVDESVAKLAPYAVLHQLMQEAVLPVFDGYVQQAIDPEKSMRLGIPVTRKKFTELALSLLHLQQNVDIPEVHLSVHPTVQSAVDQCHLQNQRVHVDILNEQTALDASFLNDLQRHVNHWIRAIQRVTRLTREPMAPTTTALQEVQFWLNMERALQTLDEQLKRDEIVLTLDLLKNAKRFHVVVSFMADTGMKEAMETVSKYNVLMKDFSLNALLSATELDKMESALVSIFSHLNKKLRLSPYPLKRALTLVEALSRDVLERFVAIIGQRRWFMLDWEQCQVWSNDAEKVFQCWDIQVKEFIQVAREVTRKRGEKLVPIKIQAAHTSFQERLQAVTQFRAQHEQLQETIQRVTRSPLLLSQLEAAYQPLLSLNVLDTTADGSALWHTAESTYHERVAALEQKLIHQLQSDLQKAATSAPNDLFHVFAQYNALFTRPKIRSAVQSYQKQLVSGVLQEIQRLQERLKAGYRGRHAATLSHVHDIPPVAGAMLWAKQLERQLDLSLDRIERVLGEGWQQYMEGAQVVQETASFRRKLDTKPLLESWLQEWTMRREQAAAVSGPVLVVKRQRMENSTLQKWELLVSFDTQWVALFKEVRWMTLLGHTLPHALQHVARDTKKVYPFAVALVEAVRTYQQTLRNIEKQPDVAVLVEVYRTQVHALLRQIALLSWETFVHPIAAYEKNKSPPHLNLLNDLGQSVQQFDEKTRQVLQWQDETQALIQTLKTCHWKAESFQNALKAVQTIIDRLNLEGYSYLSEWVAVMDERVAQVLEQRLVRAIQVWIQVFEGDTSIAASTNHDHVLPECIPSEHQLVLRDQTLQWVPWIDHARQHWIQQLWQWLSVLCQWPRLDYSSYNVLSGETQIANKKTFHELTCTPTVQPYLLQAYQAMEKKLSHVANYTNEWLQYQLLWDLEPQELIQQLGQDATRWQTALTELRRARQTVDTVQSVRHFGPLLSMHYHQVQNHVSSRYDVWQRVLLQHYAQRWQDQIKQLYQLVHTARLSLEQVHLLESGGLTPETAMTFVCLVQNVCEQTKNWTLSLDQCRNGQRLLERQRFSLPAEWMHFNHLEGEWSALSEILLRRQQSMQEQEVLLKRLIQAEDQSTLEKVKDILSDWDKQRPVQGHAPDMALQLLQQFENRLDRLLQTLEQCQRAKEALSLDTTSALQGKRLQPVKEELQDLKSVWQSLLSTHQSLQQLREMNFILLQSRPLKQSLESLLQSLKSLPLRLRQYPAYVEVQEQLQRYLKHFGMLMELKSDTMRERHWRLLLKQLKNKLSLQSSVVDALLLLALSQFTLGQVWDLELWEKHAPLVKEILATAQGEMTLERYLFNVREHWQQTVVDLVPYQQKCRLIRGWDVLLAKSMEHVNALQAMKQSPYYKVFDEEASHWHEKLTRLYLLLETWMQVQKQWVYLEGLFSGNQDMKHLLPVETTRFMAVQQEFLSLMQKTSKSPAILDLLAIPQAQNVLERLTEQLTLIQKALGEYLERERASFPRFYFIGDEALLEMLGNSRDVERVQKHVRKMFNGIGRLLVQQEQRQEPTWIVTGMTCLNQQEEIRFISPIVLDVRINEWLTLVEQQMRLSFAQNLSLSLLQWKPFYEKLPQCSLSDLLTLMDQTPDQIMILCCSILFTESVERCMANGKLTSILEKVQFLLQCLADAVLSPLSILLRKKCEHLITELVHEQDILQKCKEPSVNVQHFQWQSQMRFYFDEKKALLERCTIQMANASFTYGWEYAGVMDRLVQTPLTDLCYLTMTQALSSRLGGSPSGRAGTGKTESIKSLAQHYLGRPCLVFCCDESFDVAAMGRLFLGLCQVGAVGCFDEFNRLEERILSAVSQQIHAIQGALQFSADSRTTVIEMAGKKISVHPHTALFITMNPGYAGRNALPDNLKKLFRTVSMQQPDLEHIAKVMLFSQGFRSASLLAKKVVPLFELCENQLTQQGHYDFGLRALKSVLVSAGRLKQQSIQQNEADKSLSHSNPDQEQALLMQSVWESVAPKLLDEDVLLLKELLSELFPVVAQNRMHHLSQLREAIHAVCKKRYFTCSEPFMEKVLQLYHILQIHHGVMLVGEAATGKSAVWQVLFESLQQSENSSMTCQYHVLDPKALSKEDLFGVLDSTTREWRDGLFTQLLRSTTTSTNVSHFWIVFDGDVDPEWVENLNSVLDDNKMLTLPNGERLTLPGHVRLLFEVDSLKYATMATVSRCGMIWMGEETVNVAMRLTGFMEKLQSESLLKDKTSSLEISSIQQQCVNVLSIHLTPDLLESLLEGVRSLHHVMTFTVQRCLHSLFSLLESSIVQLLNKNSQAIDEEMDRQTIQQFVQSHLLLDLCWSFVGDCGWKEREWFMERLKQSCPLISFPSLVLDYCVNHRGEFIPWQVPVLEVDWQRLQSNDLIIPTLDTLRHESLLASFLSLQQPILLCGPAGSGKSMSLMHALSQFSFIDTVLLNFSSATTCSHLIATLDQFLECKKTLSGYVQAPKSGRTLVLFCDEINLPRQDKYGTQRVLALLRQWMTRRGYWRWMHQEYAWIQLDRVLIVGACNPPSDVGRVPLSLRFLRHCPLVWVDYPTTASLLQIYKTMMRAVLKRWPNLLPFTEATTKAMIQVYETCQQRFTSQTQAHYIYSPRELTRWMRGLVAFMEGREQNQDYAITLDEWIAIWAHEGLRLFQDRLATREERDWMQQFMEETKLTFFPGSAPLPQPLLFSSWQSAFMQRVDSYAPLKEYLLARWPTFQEEVVSLSENNRFLCFDRFLDHALHMDRVLTQIQGHLLVLGVPGSGRSLLIRFLSWLRGHAVYRLVVHSNYTLQDFDAELRHVLKQCACRGERVTLLLDESSIKESAFLERMNTLLANGVVPGLFEGEEKVALMNACKEAVQRQGLVLSGEEEWMQWFTKQVMQHLHVAITASSEIAPTDSPSSSLNRTTSPALFNRCVVLWMGDWEEEALLQVAQEWTHSLDLTSISTASMSSCLVQFHALAQNLTPYLTPRHYLAMLHHFVECYEEKRHSLEEEQRRLFSGLERLESTVQSVAQLKEELAVTRQQLEIKTRQANEKLEQMVMDQRQAEQHQTKSLAMQKTLLAQQEQITEQKNKVQSQLAEAEPAVELALASVSDIKKQHLTELRSMQNPPDAVKLVLESVSVLLGHKMDGTWKAVQSIVRRDDFISSLVQYDSSALTASVRQKLREQYLSHAQYQVEGVMRASKACGPLAQWVQAQVHYADILEHIEPWKKALTALEQEKQDTEQQAQVLQDTLKELETKIQSLKEEYAVLISDTQQMKQQMDRVRQRVDRSVALMSSLSEEKERWQTSQSLFQSKHATLVGDCVLAAACFAYSGLFESGQRQPFWQWGQKILKQNKIPYEEEMTCLFQAGWMSLQERLSYTTADEALLENILLLSKCHRPALILDTHDQLFPLWKARFATGALVVSSFKDQSYLKHVESALRFGQSLCLMDAERMDLSLMANVLSREMKRMGGRVLVKLGKEEIDVHDRFQLILVTKDASLPLSAVWTSRLTVIQASVTISALMDQCRSLLVSHLQPELEEKRYLLHSQQSEVEQKCHALEQSLLMTLGERELEEEKCLEQLEQIKKESLRLHEQRREMQHVWQQLQTVLEYYDPIREWMEKVIGLLNQMNAELKWPLQSHLQPWWWQSLWRRVLREIENGVSLSSLSRLEQMQQLKQVWMEQVWQRVARAMNAMNQQVFFTSLQSLFSEMEMKIEKQKHLQWNKQAVQEMLNEMSLQLLIIQSPSGQETPLLNFILSMEHSEMKIKSLAMGSKESRLLLDQFCHQASQEATLLLLENAHLSGLQWHEWMERIKGFHTKSRCVLQVDEHCVIGSRLLRESVYVWDEEMELGWERRVEREMGYNTDSNTIIPFELAIHALFMSRQHYVPLGFTRNYQFQREDYLLLKQSIHFNYNINYNSLLPLIYTARMENDWDVAIIESYFNEILKRNENKTFMEWKTKLSGMGLCENVREWKEREWEKEWKNKVELVMKSYENDHGNKKTKNVKNDETMNNSNRSNNTTTMIFDWLNKIENQMKNQMKNQNNHQSNLLKRFFSKEFSSALYWIQIIKKYFESHQRNDWLKSWPCLKSSFEASFLQFKASCEQAIQLNQYDNEKNWPIVNISLLFHPKSFLLVTRRFVAKQKSCPFEELKCFLSRQTGFPLKGLFLQGADWQDEKMKVLNTFEPVSLPVVYLDWTDKMNEKCDLMVPFYLDRTRKELWQSVPMACLKEEKTLLIERGVAFLAQGLNDEEAS